MPCERAQVFIEGKGMGKSGEGTGETGLWGPKWQKRRETRKRITVKSVGE